MELLGTVQGCVNVLKASHAVALFLEMIPWPLRRFHLNISRSLRIVFKMVLGKIETIISIEP